jgi:trk system potassium uptake protein
MDIKRELYKLIHPKSVISVQVGGQNVPENVINNVIAFVLIYVLIFVGFSLILLTQNMDLEIYTILILFTPFFWKN